MTTLKKAYLLYNKLYFNDALPPTTVVKWGTLIGDEEGEWTDDKEIIVNTKLRRFHNSWRLTLLHEMAHQATDDETAEHGPRWRRLMKRLYKKGAFDDLL